MQDKTPTTLLEKRLSRNVAILAFAVLSIGLLSSGCRPARNTSDLPSAPSQKAAVLPAKPPAERPSVVLIVVDCMRADAFDARRGQQPLVPELCKRLPKGWQFSRAYAQCTWTKPSVTSLMTSLYGEVHGVQYGLGVTIAEDQELAADAIPASMETAASFFKSAGYLTLGVQSNVNIDARFGMGQGFDTYSARIFPKFNADAVTDEALRLVGTKGPAPFFLYVHYMNAHAPYPVPENAQTVLGPPPQVTEGDRQWMDSFSDSYHDLVLNQLGILKERKRGDLSEEGRVWWRYKYDTALHYVDAQIGRLLDRLEKESPNTIVVVTADHGEEFWEHGSIGHGKTVYEEVARVPLLIWGAGIAPGTSDVPVELIDVLPTIAARVGLAPREGWQGRTLGSAEGMLAVRARPVFSMTHSSLRAASLYLDCVIDGSHKLVDDHKSAPKVFDLAQDPEEKQGLDANAGETGTRLLALLEAHRTGNAKHPSFAVPSSPAKIDAQTADQLNAIGYGGAR